MGGCLALTVKDFWGEASEFVTDTVTEHGISQKALATQRNTTDMCSVYWRFPIQNRDYHTVTCISNHAVLGIQPMVTRQMVSGFGHGMG